MAIFKCKMCGAALEITENATIATCDYCGSQQTLPKLEDDKIERLYDRANHFRRNNEFDKAMGIYEQILEENNHDAESYWSIVLCRYGIEYVEDPTTHKRIPTVNRAQFTSIFDDDNYKSAIEYADISQKSIYESEAKAINEIQKGILEISQKEAPFDIFICYKETDEKGQRTRDSVYANDLYHELTKEGFKVFYARITLEDKLGVAYEPYIFAALNSAKIMVVIGTKPEYFNAVWVKNEWSRYLALIKNGAKKVLIPAYSGMDPYDLPQEFSHLQAQDMTKLGFMPDLVRGIKKIIGVEQPKPQTRNDNYEGRARSGSSSAEPLLKRVKLFLENEDWTAADAKCEAALDLDPENATAYIYKLLISLHFSKEEMLAKSRTPLENMVPYKNAVRYADDATAERLMGYNREIKERIQAEEDRKREEERRLEEKRLEQQRLLEEKRKIAAAYDSEMIPLTNAKSNTIKVISANNQQKTRLENMIQSNIQASGNFERHAKVLKILSSLIFAAFGIEFLAIVLAIAVDPTFILFLMLGLFSNAILTAVLAYNAKTFSAGQIAARAAGAYFSYGIYGFIFAILMFKKSKKNDFLEKNVELQAQLEATTKQLETSRQSLQSINDKIAACNAKYSKNNGN